MSYKDFAKVEYLPFGESVELMKNRQLDATLISAGLGVAAIRDLATSVKIVIVPIPADVVAKIGEAAYQPGTVPANTYNGQTEATPTVAIQNFLVSHEGVSTDAGYKMTKAIFDTCPNCRPRMPRPRPSPVKTPPRHRRRRCMRVPRSTTGKSG
jgi:TRAP transporter TAXI family solute receptor